MLMLSMYTKWDYRLAESGLHGCQEILVLVCLRFCHLARRVCVSTKLRRRVGISNQCDIQSLCDPCCYWQLAPKDLFHLHSALFQSHKSVGLTEKGGWTLKYYCALITARISISFISLSYTGWLQRSYTHRIVIYKDNPNIFLLKFK